MTPGATAEAAIGLLAEIALGGAPADELVGSYFRRHRFAGVKDRAAISEHVFAVLRRRAALDWWIEREGRGLAPDARRRGLGVCSRWSCLSKRNPWSAWSRTGTATASAPPRSILPSGTWPRRFRAARSTT